MVFELYSRLQYELMLLNKAKADCSSELEALNRNDNYGDIILKRNVKKSGVYYYGKRNGQKRFKYIGKEKSIQVLKIKKTAHINETVKTLEENIALVKAMLDGFTDYDPGSVDTRLPLTYQGGAKLPSTDYQVVGKKWKENKISYQATFPENYPEHKTEQASDGTRMKTLSEVLIYERLLAAGLISVYELPLVSADYGPNMYPDFTVLSPIDLQTEIIIEYIGRLDLQPYRDDFAKRIYRYIQNGYIPGVNLFFIFGDKRGHVDSLQISKVIADIKGLR